MSCIHDEWVNSQSKHSNGQIQSPHYLKRDNSLSQKLYALSLHSRETVTDHPTFGVSIVRETTTATQPNSGSPSYAPRDCNRSTAQESKPSLQDTFIAFQIVSPPSSGPRLHVPDWLDPMMEISIPQCFVFKSVKRNPSPSPLQYSTAQPDQWKTCHLGISVFYLFMCFICCVYIHCICNSFYQMCYK